jgi:hypothetical protein
MVRNIFKILGCYQAEDTTQKSVGKAKFTFAERCIPESMGRKHNRQEVCWVLSDIMLSLLCPRIGQILGSQSMWLAN